MIQKLTLTQRDLIHGSRSCALVSPGQEAKLHFEGNPSQLVQLDIMIGTDLHRVHIHLPTPGQDYTEISWFKI